MIGSNVRIPGIRWVLAFIAAAMFAVAGAPGALAQQDDQYDGIVAPSGPVATTGEGIAVLPDTSGSIMILVLVGGLLLLGAGFVIRRLAGSN